MGYAIRERLSSIPEPFIWNRRLEHIWKCWDEKENARTIKGWIVNIIDDWDCRKNYNGYGYIGTSKARDFYDLYMFYIMYKESIDPEILKLAITRTANKRDSLQIMSERKGILKDMQEDAGYPVR